MILSRAWLHDTVSCAAWNDARKGVYLKPLFKTPCSNCYWGWSKPIMLDYRDISLMESVPLMWGPVTASPVGIEPMTILGGAPPPYNWYPIHNGENSTFDPGWPPNTPYACAEARRTQVADATFRDMSGGQNYLLLYPQWTWPKWVVPIGECFRTNLNIPCPLPTTLVFCSFSRLLIYLGKWYFTNLN